MDGLNLPYTDGLDGNGITNTAELLHFLRGYPMQFYSISFMDSYLDLLIPVGDEVLAIFDAQPPDLLVRVRSLRPRGRDKFGFLTLKFDRRLALAVSYSMRPGRGIPIGDQGTCGPVSGAPGTCSFGTRPKDVVFRQLAVLACMATKEHRNYIFCPNCSALESIGMRRDARFVQQTSNCHHACFALKDKRPNNGRYDWCRAENTMLVACCCAQRMYDENQ
ncbi:hypothetical protein B484DRAFT_483999 [Ochromonadaceae sp. CCMP2298]|nr:hypothetical protein B484DRAFT_483999 [Ochromonadaceae sp. CCMP2298]